MHICPRVMELLKEKGLDDVQVVIGGIIPDIDIAKLNAMGIKGIFIPGHAHAADHRLHHRQRQGEGVTAAVGAKAEAVAILPIGVR